MPAGSTPDRLLVIGPSWVGDAVMATPALRLIRKTWPHTRIDLVTRNPVDQLLAGLPLLDTIIAARPRGLAERGTHIRRLRSGRYDAALLLSNALEAALVATLANIPVRVGYARDGRSLLLTRRLRAPSRPGSTLLRPRWAPIPAVDYYLTATRALLGTPTPGTGITNQLELALTDHDRAETTRVLASAGIDPRSQWVILNPGGNNPAKRWPADRYIALASHLAQHRGLRVLINGSPAESDLTHAIAKASGAVDLPAHKGSIPSLKGLVAGARLLVTNDTGPRHIAAAFGTPVVTLFGPTDHRWTTIPTRPLSDGTPSETLLLADPDLPEDHLANDHPDRCRIERITLQGVLEACERLLTSSGPVASGS